MAFITKTEGTKLKLQAQDYRDLAEITRKRKMKRGETGYSAGQIRNFTIYGFACSPEMKELILNFKKQPA
jgi:hypothetical protein